MVEVPDGFSRTAIEEIECNDKESRIFDDLPFLLDA
jgi:hypothetical protein